MVSSSLLRKTSSTESASIFYFICSMKRSKVCSSWDIIHIPILCGCVVIDVMCLHAHEHCHRSTSTRAEGKKTAFPPSLRSLMVMSAAVVRQLIKWNDLCQAATLDMTKSPCQRNVPGAAKVRYMLLVDGADNNKTAWILWTCFSRYTIRCIIHLRAQDLCYCGAYKRLWDPVSDSTCLELLSVIACGSKGPVIYYCGEMGQR